MPVDSKRAHGRATSQATDLATVIRGVPATVVVPMPAPEQSVDIRRIRRGAACGALVMRALRREGCATTPTDTMPTIDSLKRIVK
jgi:hypothetical protein